MLASRWQVATIHLEAKHLEPGVNGEEPGPLRATGPIDLVLGYRDRRKIERLANRSEGRLRVVDAASAYFRLEPEEYEPLVLYQAIKHLLRLPDRPV